jgi:Integrase core domain.
MKILFGWSLDIRMARELAIAAMKQAISKHRPDPGLIFHSDRGVQYAAMDYQELLRQNQIVQSMSRKGNCYDNACGESFFASLEKRPYLW